MGFQGIVIPDAMDMAALTQMFPGGRSAVEAFKAGNDMIVIPADLETSFNAMVRAVQSRGDRPLPVSTIPSARFSMPRLRSAYFAPAWLI